MTRPSRIAGSSFFAKPLSPLARLGTVLDHRPGIASVLWLAAVLRVVSVFLLRTYRHPNAWEFGEIARAIHAGLGYSISLPHGGLAPSAYMPPAYPYLLVLLLKLGGDRSPAWLVLELVQAALGVLLVYVIYRTALLLAERRVAIAGAILVAVFPTQVYACNEFHSINFYMVLGAFTVFYLTRYLEQSGAWKDIVLAGFSMGFLMLFRAEAPALLFLYAVVLVWRQGWRAMAPAAVFIAIALLCLAPWTLRNYVAFGKFIPVAVSAGENLWIGNNAHATGSQHYDYGAFSPEDLRRDLARVPENRDYQYARDKVFERYAVHFALTHPLSEVKLMLTKLAIFFVYDPAHIKGRQPIYWVPSVLLSVLAAYGAWLRGGKLWKEDLIIVVSVLFAVAVTAAVFALPRYKIVIDPFLMIFAAQVVSRWGRSGEDHDMAPDAADTRLSGCSLYDPTNRA
jgi:4-amino-4-deoxy-L-arabinose transferase-like glycosyltransferase